MGRIVGLVFPDPEKAKGTAKEKPAEAEEPKQGKTAKE